MNTSPQQILVVKIETIENNIPENAVFGARKLQEATVYKNLSNCYFVSTGIDLIKKAITDAVPQLAQKKKYRTCLLFDVRVLSGDEADAVAASVRTVDKKRKRRSLTL